MQNDKTALLLNEIGNLLKTETNCSLSVLLYAEVASNAVSGSIFTARGNQIECRFPEDNLTDALMDLWDEQPNDPPWVAIEYSVHEGRFKLVYTYADDSDWDEEFDRQQRVVHRYFGDTPIIYPPMPRNRFGLTFKL